LVWTSDTALNEEQKRKTLELYDQASQWLQQALETRAQLSQLEVVVNEAPQRIEAILANKAKRTLELPALDPILVAGEAEKIDLALTQEQVALRQATEAQRALSDELDVLLLGGKALSEEIGTRIDALEQIDADLQTPAAEAPSPLHQARTALFKARRMFRQAELELFKLRLGSRDLLINLTQAERDFTRTQISERQKRLDALSEAAQALREAQARQSREQAEALERKTESLPPVLQTIAEENARFRRELEELMDGEKSAFGDLQATRRRLEEITSDLERTRQRVEAVGTTPAIGRLLMRRRDALPSPQAYRRTAAARSAENERATDRQIDIDELLRERGPVPAVVARVVESLPEPERQRHEVQAWELARSRRDAPEELQKVYGRYAAQIASLSLAERQVVETADAYTDYIDHQLIWLPGPGIGEMLAPAQLGSSLAWLFAAERWAEVAKDAGSVARQRPLWVGSIGLGFILLLPLSLAVTSALGYHYAAWHLDLRAEQTLSFFIGLFLLKELLLRALLVAERRLRLKDALRRRDESRAQRAQGQAERKGEPSPITLDIPEISFDELSEQSKRLIHAGFLFGAVLGISVIWSGVVPALSFISETELPFHVIRILDGIAKEAPLTLGI
jgi:small-conductance mechanosensitive channel